MRITVIRGLQYKVPRLKQQQLLLLKQLQQLLLLKFQAYWSRPGDN